ncbi:MAG TPA: sigma-70 family RNA polymerase sigma factor [Candidatus Binataceae bacterium]|nr:sigma-70 family RNA polymerase sigma factor [Candidatus Binataceae bacterium]
MANRSASAAANCSVAEIPLAIVAQARAGDERALEDLIRRYQGRIARFVIAQTGEHHDYEDLCQAIFVKMVLALPRLKRAEVFEAWLFRIARNVCIDHLRHRRWWQRIFVAYQTDHEPRAEESTRDEQRSAELGYAIDRLPAPERDLITLAREHEYGYRELARLSNLSVAALKSRLFRARARLRKLMADGDVPSES